MNAIGWMKEDQRRVQCWTCFKEMRKDRLVEHIRSNVILVMDNNCNDEMPTESDNNEYVLASEVERNHTDYI